MTVREALLGFLDRFVHPRVAAVALLGVALVAAAAVASVLLVGLGNLGYYGLEYRYVPLASLVSLIGILLWTACGLYLAAIWVLRDVLGLVGSGKPL